VRDWDSSSGGLADRVRRRAVRGRGGLWAGGRCRVRCGPRLGDDGGAPWAFTRAEIASFAGHGLETVTIARLDDGTPRWRAEFTRLEGRASSR